MMEEPRGAELVKWHLWVAERPAAVRALVERFPPWKHYVVRGSVYRWIITAYDENKDGTITLSLRGASLIHGHGGVAFGVHPDDVEAA